MKIYPLYEMAQVGGYFVIFNLFENTNSKKVDPNFTLRKGMYGDDIAKVPAPADLVQMDPVSNGYIVDLKAEHYAFALEELLISI